ncbi:MAG: alpha/beta hydrolase [Pseudochelatococcus sp.]|jgi:phospholipase/carboxylesterase|uniref:alpha/beta hydrolase n=1 Tax=Pseudochelatococcus sp. TaxID=2020869 RepID=UPI003D8F2B24
MSIDAYPYLHRDPAPGAPLVFAFHGTGGDESQFFGLIRDMLPDAGVVSPRGDVSERGANRFFRRTGEGVYDMPDLAMRTERMAGFVVAHRARHPRSPAVGLGYSNGANILASTILHAPALYDRAVLMHPLVPWEPAPDPRLAALDILITAGERDPVCPWPLTKALVDFFGAQGSRVGVSLHPGGHEVSRGELADVEAFLKNAAGAPLTGSAPTA